MRQLSLLAVAVATALVLVLAAFDDAADAESNQATTLAQESSAQKDRLEDLRKDIASLREDVEDLQEPVEEFDLFDQCMFTIGVTQYGRRDGDSGYLYGKSGRERRPALAMDMRGFDPPEYDFLAFPGEEPPQIECNEDAGGQNTDE